jgi:mannose-6-phosphate isomerase-like protein (cupin superfamily)
MNLAGYTIVNLMELENRADEGGPTVEARFARTAIESEHVGVSHFRYAPGRRSNRGHSHTEQEEVYVVLSGSGRVKLDDELVGVRPWDVVRVAPGTFRGFAAGPEGLELLAIGSDRPEGGDAGAVRRRLVGRLTARSRWAGSSRRRSAHPGDGAVTWRSRSIRRALV